MKYESYLNVDSRIDEQLLEQILQLAGVKSPVKEEKYYSIRAPLSSTKEFSQIIELLEKGNIRYDILSMLERFEKEEIERASYFEVFISGTSIDVYSKSSDKKAIQELPVYWNCINCSKPIDDDKSLCIKKPSKNIDIFHAASIDRYVVTGRVREAFIENQITGIEYLPVYVRGQELPSSEYYELKVKNAMPSLRKEDNPVLLGERLSTKIYCRNCGRSYLRNGTPNKRIYRVEDESALCDFNYSLERYYAGLRSLVVSKRVQSLCVTNSFKGIRFDPIITVLTNEGKEIINVLDQTMTSGVPGKPGVDRKPRTVTMSIARRKASRHFEQALTERILRSAVQSYRLYEKAPSGTPVFSNRIGGFPDLPSNIPWPEWKDRRLDFIAQINCSQLPKDAIDLGFPGKGMMWFFFDLTEQPWGNEPQDKGGFRVLYQEAPSPDELQTEDKEQESIVSPRYIGFTKELTFSPVLEDALADMEINDDLFGRYIDFLDSLHGEEDDLSRLGGYPDAVNRDLRIVSSIVSKGNKLSSDSYATAEAEAKEETKNWIMLLQIDSNEDMGLMFGDLGKIAYYIERDKLAKLDFSNVWCVLSCN